MMRAAMHRVSRWLESRSPYQSLVILAIPLAIVEPAKLVAVAIAGEGHWFTGTIVLIVAYALSILVVERLFRILKPNLLKLRWFAKGWRWFVGIRAKAIAPFTKEH
jgi:hypothetical protein